MLCVQLPRINRRFPDRRHRRRAAIPLADIRAAEARRPDTIRTAVGAVLAAALLTRSATHGEVVY